MAPIIAAFLSSAAASAGSSLFGGDRRASQAQGKESPFAEFIRMMNKKKKGPALSANMVPSMQPGQDAYTIWRAMNAF